MSEALLRQRPAAAIVEKLLWLAGRVLHLIPADARIQVPFGLNRRLTWIRGAANAPEWLGIYEYRKQRVLGRFLFAGDTVCDIGANAGFYTLAMSRLVGRTGRVLAFEPLPHNLAKLGRHLELNKLENVTVSSCALSDETGTVAFACGDSDFTGRIAPDAANTFEVTTTTLDEFLIANSISAPSFLKIDVEGAEARVLAGAQGLINSVHPTLLIAIHGTQAAHDCFFILRKAGYFVTSLSGREIDRPEAMPAEILARYRVSA